MTTERGLVSQLPSPKERALAEAQADAEARRQRVFDKANEIQARLEKGAERIEGLKHDVHRAVVKYRWLWIGGASILAFRAGRGSGGPRRPETAVMVAPARRSAGWWLAGKAVEVAVRALVEQATRSGDLTHTDGAAGPVDGPAGPDDAAG